MTIRHFKRHFENNMPKKWCVNGVRTMIKFIFGYHQIKNNLSFFMNLNHLLSLNYSNIHHYTAVKLFAPYVLYFVYSLICFMVAYWFL